MANDQEIQSPSDTLNKLSQALIQVSRGDPLIALRNELQTRFASVEAQFKAIEKATDLQHQDQVRVPTQIDQAILGLRELFEAEIAGIRDSVADVRTYSRGRPEDLDHAISHLRDLLSQTIKTEIAGVVGALQRHVAETAEKFAGVKDQFGGRDTALAAALLAQKTSVEDQNKSNAQAATKAEDRFTKEIDSAKDTVTAQARTFDDKINAVRSEFGISTKSAEDKIEDIRSRIGAVENQKKGSVDNWGAILGVGGLVAAIVTGAFIGFSAMQKPTQVPVVIERSATGDKVLQ